MTITEFVKLIPDGKYVLNADRNIIDDLVNTTWHDIFSTLDSDPDHDAESAGRIATEVSDTFRRLLVAHYAVDV